MTACLDSWAVLAWLRGDHPAWDAVDDALETHRPVINWMNLGEVYYVIRRNHGAVKAAEVVNDLRFSLDCELPTERRILKSMELKAEHPIAIADCFAISTAADNDAVLYTGDPEILAIKDLPCDVRDLRG